MSRCLAQAAEKLNGLHVVWFCRPIAEMEGLGKFVHWTTMVNRRNNTSNFSRGKKNNRFLINICTYFFKDFIMNTIVSLRGGVEEKTMWFGAFPSTPAVSKCSD